MKISVSRTGSYIPTWRDNRELLESEQVVVEYDYLDWNERQKFITKDKTKLIIDDIETKDDGEVDREIAEQHSKFEMTFLTDDAGIVTAMKPRIKNLKDDNDNAIDTWQKLLKTPVTPKNKVDKLIAEITRKLSGESKEKDTKNLE